MSDIETLQPEWPAPARVKAFSTTRHGGRSSGCFAGLNLGDHVGDDPARVAANRMTLRRSLQLPSEPRWLTQVHATRVIETESTAPGCEADGSVSSSTGTVCAVLTADCLPVLLCDRAGDRVAALHAGWRGLAAGVFEAGVSAMQRPPAELLAWIGPAIGPAAFEVGAEVVDALVAADAAAAACFKRQAAAYLADLPALARLRLRHAGVNAVYGGDCCTYSDPERFYSYRRDGRTGRQATLIWIA